MKQSLNDLDNKVCQNCVQTYQKCEEHQLKLTEAQRKVERLENQLKLTKGTDTEATELVENLKGRLDSETRKSEELQGKVKDLETQRQDLNNKIESLEEKL